MKEIYDWVPWFRELAKKIEDGGENYLIEKANKVKWGGNSESKYYLLKHGNENIDPFSFFYFLAQKNTTDKTKREPIYESVSNEFGLSAELPKAGREGYYNHPTQRQNNALFHDGKNTNPSLLWKLFRQAVKDEPDVQPEDFDGALIISEVAIRKLTRCLFLINPYSFIPVYIPPVQKNKRIDGWIAYEKELEYVRQAFPGCCFYEIGQVYWHLYDLSQKSERFEQNYYQISTNAYNDGKDHWSNFKENNWVFTGGPGSGKHRFPLEEPKPGDIILVRTGEYRGRAIGIVEENDYADKGYYEDGKIHVLWINKTENEFSKRTGVRDGFSKVGADYQIYNAFRNLTKYTPTFEFIERLMKDSIMLRTVEDKTQVIENAKNFNKLTTTSDSYVYTVFNNFTHWYYLKESDLFAPSKFIGYENTTIENYHRGEGRDGRETEKVLKNWFHPLEQGATNFDVLSKKLHQYVNGLHKKIRKGYVIHIENGPESHPSSHEQESEPHPLNQILFGPPGTGKTWNTVNHAVAIIEGKPVDDYEEDKDREKIKQRFNELKEAGRIEMVTFHQNYAYEDFIEGIKPVLSGKDETEDKEQGDKRDIKYELSEGIFKRIASRAEENRAEEKNYVLIIDEINRGNIAKTFGELITLIEESKRLGNNDEATTVLPYSKKPPFGVPNNLYIIGTMNTADRSIALLDTALRRRFDFVEMMPYPKHSGISQDIQGVNCQELLEKINERIRILHDRDHQIGHTYFLGVKDLASLAKTFKNRIIPLLQEYFYDNWEKIDLVLNKNGFIQDSGANKGLFKTSEFVDPERKIYELLPANNDKWQDPDSYIDIYLTPKQSSQERQENQNA